MTVLPSPSSASPHSARHPQLDQVQFCKCLAECANVALSRPPYNAKYQTAGDRADALFKRIGLKDRARLRERLKEFGGFYAGKASNARSNLRPSPPAVQQQAQQESGTAARVRGLRAANSGSTGAASARTDRQRRRSRTTSDQGGAGPAVSSSGSLKGGGGRKKKQQADALLDGMGLSFGEADRVVDNKRRAKGLPTWGDLNKVDAVGGNSNSNNNHVVVSARTPAGGVMLESVAAAATPAGMAMAPVQHRSPVPPQGGTAAGQAHMPRQPRGKKAPGGRTRPRRNMVTSDGPVGAPRGGYSQQYAARGGKGPAASGATPGVRVGGLRKYSGPRAAAPGGVSTRSALRSPARQQQPQQPQQQQVYEAPAPDMYAAAGPQQGYGMVPQQHYQQQAQAQAQAQAGMYYNNAYVQQAQQAHMVGGFGSPRHAMPGYAPAAPAGYAPAGYGSPVYPPTMRAADGGQAVGQATYARADAVAHAQKSRDAAAEASMFQRLDARVGQWR